MNGKNKITPRGTDEEIVIKFEKATLAIDAATAKVKADADQFGVYAQDKRKAGFPDQAVGFEASQNKLLCKWNGMMEALRIIKANVE